MADQISPFPLNTAPNSFEWNEWYMRLTALINSLTLEHNLLTGIQGGSSGQYYHLTSAQHTALTTNISQTIGDNFHTYFPSGWA